MSTELEHFARIAGDNPFREWLEAQRKEWTKYLMEASDMVVVARAQGRLQLIERILSNLDQARNGR